MSEFATKPCTAFIGNRLLAAGPLIDVALAVKAAGGDSLVLTFDDATGAVVDLDLRGSRDDILARLAERDPVPEQPHSSGEAGARARGRPKLGVVAREVTLLPRHWDWLASQPGGASVALRRLVEEARRADGGQSRLRAGREAAYRFMSAMGGDLPGFEEAARALFAGDAEYLAAHMTAWPDDLRAYAVRLASGSAKADSSATETGR
ncbi:DUF2239 family protein [Aquabacter sp. CN5-332]|uniref:DUF2239 family protein n=1 Tax=Aquabacter sp. CN5-332 TaxID=3156608 RepID=UPI0032B3984E